jgi:hypothetical protein
MSHKTAIENCREVLIMLSSENDIERRVYNAFLEITALEPEDTSLEYYQEVVEWCEKYHSVADDDIKSGEVQKKVDKKKELAKLSHELAFLCSQIIEYNAQNS